MSEDPSIVRRTERLVLRYLRPEDADDAFRIWCSDEVKAFLGAGNEPEQLRSSIDKEAATPIEERERIGWLSVCSAITDQLVGDVGLVEKEVDGVVEIEIVYLVDPRLWGQGIATEAAQALCGHAFETLELPRLIALIRPDNSASMRVAEKLGFRFDRDTTRPSGKVMKVFVQDRPQAK